MMILNKLRSFTLITILTILSTACVNAGSTSEDGAGTIISGTTDVSAGTLVILNKITDVKLEIKDSTTVGEKGKFQFQGDYGNAEGEIFFVTFKTTSPPGIPVVVESNDKIKLDIKQNGKSYDVVYDGGKYNGEMSRLFNVYTTFERDMDKFNADVAVIDPTTVTEQIRKETNERYTALISRRSEQIENFIKTEKGTPATYFAVKYLFQEQVPKLVLLANEKVTQDMPTSTYATRLAAASAQIGPTVPGAVAPDINLKTPEGELLALSSLRGKVVLIDFWASWCGPCRKENPNVKKLYSKYKDKGFEIYAVSLDNSASRWKQAIEKDGLPWKHVSDLGGWKSSAAKLYAVRSIPQTFLLDEEGRIIKTGLRSHQLDQVLGELLN